MKTLARCTSLLTRLGLTAAAVLLSQQAMAVGTDAGTTVSNLATVVYEVNGNLQTGIESDPAGNSTPGANQGTSTDFVVDRRVDFDLTEDGVTATVAPGDVGITFDFSLTNESNGVMDFEVSFRQMDSTDPAVNGLADTDADVANAVITAYVDNLAEDGNTTVTVTGDAALSLVNGDVANIEVTVIARDPAGDAGNIIALVDGAGNADTPGAVDNVFADPDNDATELATDGMQVVSAALSVTKTSQVISDPFGGVAPNAKAVPGAIIEYTVTIDNSGGAAPAENIVVTDNIQIPDALFEDEAYGAGQDVAIDAAFCNADGGDGDGDGCSYDAVSGLLSIAVPNIANGASTTITYQVQVNAL